MPQRVLAPSVGAVPMPRFEVLEAGLRRPDTRARFGGGASPATRAKRSLLLKLRRTYCGKIQGFSRFHAESPQSREAAKPAGRRKLEDAWQPAVQPRLA